MKLVLSTSTPRSKSLKALAAKLSERLGYRVWRVKPSRVGSRYAVSFLKGIDKRDQLADFAEHGVNCPDFMFGMNYQEDPREHWNKVVVRHITKGSEGRGIEIVENVINMVPSAPLYVQYIKKAKEFRVHVWNNEVIDVAEKRKRKEHNDERNTQIRNVANGYVFCRSDLVEPDDLRGLALAAVSALERTSGAVDIIWNKKQNKCYVLEVNARPGMEGTTLEKYVEAIVAGLPQVLKEYNALPQL